MGWIPKDSPSLARMGGSTRVCKGRREGMSDTSEDGGPLRVPKASEDRGDPQELVRTGCTPRDPHGLVMTGEIPEGW